METDPIPPVTPLTKLTDDISPSRSSCPKPSLVPPIREGNIAPEGPPSAAPRVPTEKAPDTANPIFQRALEILRRELPHGATAPDATTQPAQINVPPDQSAALFPNPATPVSDEEHHAKTIPARMLNEFVYCRRLFYYEFVEGVFVESADTLRGSAIHQRVDSGSGSLPAAKRKSPASKDKAADKSPTGEDTAVPEPNKQSSE